MPYSQNENAGGLDTLSSLAAGDLLVAGDVDDSNRLKGITKTNLVADLADETQTLTNKTINTASNTITVVEADISDLGSYITASSSDTLTNKTFDANGTGNSISNVDLSADVTGNLPVANLNSGTSASSSTFWRGDGTWAAAGTGSGNTETDVNQVAHGFSVGDWIKFAAGSYSKAQADSAANAEVVGVVSAVEDVDNFTVTQVGHVTGLSGLTQNTVYFLDPDTAGAQTATETTTAGEVSKPILLADSTTSGWVLHYRGMEVTATGDGDMSAATYDPNTVAGDAFLMSNMNGTADRMFYSDGSGDVVELAHGTSGQVLTSNGATSAPSWQAAASGSGTTEWDVNQVAHGLAVGDVIKFASGSYSKAQADSAANAEVVGIVSAVAGVDDFTVTQVGQITGLSGLTANTVYFLDPSTAGGLTATETSTTGEISKPVLFADGTTSGWVLHYRGMEITATGAIPSALNDLGDATVSAPSGGQVLVYDGSDSFDNVTMSGDVTINSSGVAAIGSGVIVNADVNASAAIDASKIHDGSISNTEYGYLNGVTSAIQTQLDAKLADTTPFVKSITVEDPTASEDLTMFFTDDAITVTQLNAVLAGGTSTPSVTYTIRHGTDRSAAGAEVVTSGSTTTSVSTGDEVTSFNDATIVAGSWVWLETTAQSGTVPELHVTMEYTRD